MSQDDLLTARITEAVTRFEGRNMALKPKSMVVALHPPYLLVTLRGAVSAAERDYGRDRASGERLSRLYAQVFDAGKAELEEAVAGIVGRAVVRSRIDVDPILGDVILVFLLGDEPTDQKTVRPSANQEP